jgi:predicted unusual protein kinase regulating ubiquinone biosynthesis (AarF/ABC1/UbiB family)
MDEKKLPQGRLGRLARLAAAGARSGAGLVLSRGQENAAHHAAEVLGQLRGLAAKVGQMASYVDGVIPEEHRDAYEGAMKRLRSAAPTSSREEVRALVEEDLGAPLDRLFVEWDDRPLASASIGQVHRARLEDGREVAVKVQHPGITKALEADLENAGIVEQMAALMGARRMNSKDMLAIVRTRFREELDYGLEAERQRLFSRIHRGDAHIRIPEVVDHRSSRRVLTSELVRGAGFDDACSQPEAERAEWARTLWRFVFKGNLVGGVFNADPHPGNYVFHDGGAVSFLDFGCVQPISDEHRLAARAMHAAGIARDEAAFRVETRKMLGTRPGPYEDLLVGFVRACFEPLFRQPFRFTRRYAGSLVDHIKAMAMGIRKLPDEEIVPVPANFFFMNRLQFGFYSVLARMDVEVDYAEVERAFMRGA